MSEVWIEAGGRNAITIRLEPNNIRGRDMAGQPALSLPLEMQLLPTGDQTNMDYTLVRLAGKLQNQHLSEFARFDLGPMAAAANPNPFFTRQEAIVTLDRHQVKRFEDARSGKDAYFQVVLNGLAWFPAKGSFEVTRPSGHLDVKIPRSVWADQVLTNWNISSTRLVEIEFPASKAGGYFRDAYARVEEAERDFANGQYKETLTSLRQSFEGVANKLGYEGRDRVKACIEHLFADADVEKKQKATEALFKLYQFLHLGPHEHAGQPDAMVGPPVSRKEARFALTMTQAIFEYITPRD